MENPLPTWRRTLIVVPVALVGAFVAFKSWRQPMAPQASDRAAPKRSTPPGLWNPVRFPGKGGGNPAVPQATTDALAALPYLQGYKPAREQTGVTVHDRSRAFPGVNLFISGHAAEASLIDMAGTRIHSWRMPAERVWPDVGSTAESSRYWRRVYAFDNGDLLAIFDGLGLVKLDRESRVLWSFREDCHHDLFVDREGTIYVLTRKARIIPEVHASRPSLEEFVTVLDANGRPQRSISLYAAFKNSPYAPLLARVSQGGDIFHTNTLTIFDGSLAHRSPHFARGRALISLRNLDTVAILDLSGEKVVWALTGLWRGQHEPSLLASGRMLVFDNAGRDGHSRVLEIDPFTQQVAWQYPDRPAQVDLVSETSGSTQRLPNGNTLITESTTGRALEVTPEGQMVWEFWNPYRAGKENELIATLLEVVRLDAGFGRDTWPRGQAQGPMEQRHPAGQ